MKQTALVLVMIGLLATACNNDEKLSKDIVGEWHGASWVSQGKPVVPDASAITLIFSKEGIYNLVMENRIENGDWKIKQDTLVLIPESTEDVKMRIISLTADQLKLRFNRGQVEELELKR